MKFERFSEKQLQTLTWWSDASPYRDWDAIICDGAVRSGKTLCMGISFLCWAMRRFDGERFALCGKTITSLRRNLVSVLLPVMADLGFSCKEKVSQDLFTVEFGGRRNTFHLFGGQHEGSPALIQGITLAGVLLDEVALMPRAFVEQALALNACAIILCRSDLCEKYRGIVSKTCVISTPLDVWQAVRLLFQAIPSSRVAKTEGIACFHLDDYLDDVREAVLKNRYRSYPVLDAENKVVGTLSRYHLIQPRRKRIVLVDHNEVGQSVPGLEQAELVGIIDHHRLADVQTGYPVFMRNEPVGSTNTIIGTLFQENGLMPGEKLAGLMAAAIISDTVMFKSPTTTPRDRRMAERLARIAGLDLDALGQEVFSGSNADKTAEQLLKTDFKEFHLADHRLGIAQITTMESAGLLKRKAEFLTEMKKMQKDKDYDMVLLMITDVLKEGTELLFLGDREVIRQAFNPGRLREDHAYLPGIMSRKKQMVPALALLWG